MQNHGRACLDKPDHWSKPTGSLIPTYKKFMLSNKELTIPRKVGTTRKIKTYILSDGPVLHVEWAGLRWMVCSLSLADFGNLGLEEDDNEDDDTLERAVDVRPGIPPLGTPATEPELSPLPALRFLPNTGKGDVETGLLVELCLLSAIAAQNRLKSTKPVRAMKLLETARGG